MTTSASNAARARPRSASLYLLGSHPFEEAPSGEGVFPTSIVEFCCLHQLWRLHPLCSASELRKRKRISFQRLVEVTAKRLKSLGLPSGAP